jgi:hypothetical protein
MTTYAQAYLHRAAQTLARVALFDKGIAPSQHKLGFERCKLRDKVPGASA